MAADKGLGYQIMAATAFFNTPAAFGALVILSLLGIVLFQAVGDHREGVLLLVHAHGSGSAMSARADEITSAALRAGLKDGLPCEPERTAPGRIFAARPENGRGGPIAGCGEARSEARIVV